METLVALYGETRAAKIATLEARLAERDEAMNAAHAAYLATATPERFESEAAWNAYRAADDAWTKARHLRNRTAKQVLRAY